MLGWRHDVELLRQTLDKTNELASMEEEVKVVKALAKAWDKELKKESEALSKQLFTNPPIEFAESILGR